MYSQKKEDYLIWDYFKNQPPGNLLDIGANDGRLFSNSLWLIEHGWGGVMVEPAPGAFAKLQENHGNNPKLHLMKLAITDHDGEVEFFESGAVKVYGRVPNTGLVSTIHPDFLVHWKKRSVPFNVLNVPCLTFKTFIEQSPIKKFEFITCDAEGEDFNILQQMDLGELGCQFICIEHDKNISTDKFIEYIAKWGFTERARTQVNLLMAK